VLALRRLDIYNTSIQKLYKQTKRIVLLPRVDATPIASTLLNINKIILTLLRPYIKRFKCN